jgi:E3 ubiquitin-protein ligase HERC2
VHRVYAGSASARAIGRGGAVFTWGLGENGTLGHGDRQNQPLPKRVEALRGVGVISASVGSWQALALTQYGKVYIWEEKGRPFWGNPSVESDLLPKPVETLRGVRVGSVAPGDDNHSYAVARHRRGVGVGLHRPRGPSARPRRGGGLLCA